MFVWLMLFSLGSRDQASQIIKMMSWNSVKWLFKLHGMVLHIKYAPMKEEKVHTADVSVCSCYCLQCIRCAMIVTVSFAFGFRRNVQKPFVQILILIVFHMHAPSEEKTAEKLKIAFFRFWFFVYFGLVWLGLVLLRLGRKNNNEPILFNWNGGALNQMVWYEMHRPKWAWRRMNGRRKRRKISSAILPYDRNKTEENRE